MGGYGGGNESIQGYSESVVESVSEEVLRDVIRNLARTATDRNLEGQHSHRVFGPAVHVRVMVETWHEVPESSTPLVRP